MHLKTILNRVEHYKSFVYGKVRMTKHAGSLQLEVQLRPRANGRPICSGCHRVRPGYDRLPPRRFEFVPLWAIPVFFVYAMRRVDCPKCGVTVEEVPWGDGNCTLTKSYRWFLAGWARRLSWKETAEAFHTSWDKVFRAVKYAVMWGLVHRELKAVKAIGVDEIQWRRGHQYLTLVYQIDQGVKRLLWVARDRTEASLEQFFQLLGKPRARHLKFTCSDLWQPYLNVLRERAKNAVLVLDRFHIMVKLNKALDEVRAGEARRLERDGYEPVLKHSRWCLLKRPANLTRQQTVKLSELLKYNLQSVRGYLLREDFQRFWEYTSPTWARKFLQEWCRRAMRTKLGPLKKVVRTLRKNEELLLNWFRAGGTISAGTVEGLNNKAKLTMRRSYGFRTAEGIEFALFHALGQLPEPEFTHEFC
jgi:transposase